MANILTGIRILCGLLILCFPAFSKIFYWLYLLGGFTDAIDGTVARKMGTVSDFGSKFDTVADFVFTVSVAIKILHKASFPMWMIIWIVIIAFVKISCHLVGYLKHHEFRTVHSVLNKVCGVVVFIVPLFIGLDFERQITSILLFAVCLITSIAAIVEGVSILCET